MSTDSIKIDGLVKSPIYVVVDREQRLAVPHVLPNRRSRYYALYIELFPESISATSMTFYESIKIDKAHNRCTLQVLVYTRGTCRQMD